METKPGVKTTEFWTSAILALVGPFVTIFVGAGIFNAEDAPVITDTITTSVNGAVEAVTILVSNVVSLLSVKSYVKSRTDVKVAEAEASATE